MVKVAKPDPDEWLTLIAKKIKELRKEKGYTSYEAFALEYGLDRKQYWRVESGANITLRTLIKVLEIHELSLVAFFQEISEIKGRQRG